MFRLQHEKQELRTSFAQIPQTLFRKQCYAEITEVKEVSTKAESRYQRQTAHPACEKA